MKFWFGRKRESELDEEIQAHLAMAKQDRPEDEVRREFGNLTLIKEVTREMWGWGSVERLWQDLRLGSRGFLKNPAFTITALLSLGFGIGANTTIFTLVNTIFLNPLPITETSQLASIHTTDPSGKNFLPVSRMNWEDIRKRNSVFSDVAAFSSTQVAGMSRTPSARPERFFVELVTSNYFEVLGMQPFLGRYFLAEEDRTRGSYPVVVLNFGTWQQRFGSEPNVVGQTIRLNGIPFTVIGVAPPNFKGVNVVFGPDGWIQSMMAEQLQPVQMKDWLNHRGTLVFRLAGRLKPATTLAQADANLRAVGASLEKDFPEVNKQRGLTARSIKDVVVTPDQRDPSVLGTAILMTIAGLVLLIACSNVANLLLARASARRQEMAIRIALGAGRFRLIRQLLTESVLLALMSGLLGLFIAYGSLRLLSTFRPSDVTVNLMEPKLDPTVFLFALAISIATGFIFGIAPALEGSRTQLFDVMKKRGRRITFRNTLLVGQVAFSLLALITASLFLRGIERAYAIDPGFETKHLALILLDPGQAGYNQARTEQYFRDVRSRVGAVPGIVNAALASNLPFWGRMTQGVRIAGIENPDRANNVTTLLNRIQPGYFSVMGIGLVHGRDFTDADREGAAPVAIINDAMAALYWPGQDAIGRQIQLSGETAYRTIVGVAKNANYQSLGETPRPCIHVPFAQSFSSSMVLYLRTNGDPIQATTLAQRELRALDSQVSADDARTAGKVIDQALWFARLGVGLLSMFGLLGLGLASIGLYGVTAYSVSQRRQEIGVRMALGASQDAILRLVLLEMMKLVTVGIVIGIVAALFTGNLLSSMLFGVGALDPISLAGASLVLCVVVLVACSIPAWRASRLDPMLVLRQT